MCEHQCLGIWLFFDKSIHSSYNFIAVQNKVGGSGGGTRREERKE